MVKIKFIKSNDADSFMKNSPGNLFEKHAKKLVRKCGVQKFSKKTPNLSDEFCVSEVDVEAQQEGC